MNDNQALKENNDHSAQKVPVTTGDVARELHLVTGPLAT